MEKTIDEKKNEKKVLIIIDNLYEDKYQRHKKQPVPVPETFIHNFKKPLTLKREVRLYKHQREGIAWMESLFENKYPGGLLADDMGLGKTLQILSFIDWHNATQNKEKKPYLIIAPVTLLENWQAEFRHFFNSDIEMPSVYGSGNNQITLDKMIEQGRVHSMHHHQLRCWIFHIFVFL